MDELNAFETLARAARAEEPRVGRVAGRVMNRVRALRRSPARWLGVFAAVSVAAAALVLVVGLALGGGSDPLTELSAPLEVVSLW